MQNKGKLHSAWDRADSGCKWPAICGAISSHNPIFVNSPLRLWASPQAKLGKSQNQITHIWAILCDLLLITNVITNVIFFHFRSLRLPWNCLEPPWGGPLPTLKTSDLDFYIMLLGLLGCIAFLWLPPLDVWLSQYRFYNQGDIFTFRCLLMLV